MHFLAQRRFGSACHATCGATAAITLLLPKCPLCWMAFSSSLIAGQSGNWVVVLSSISLFAYASSKVCGSFHFPESGFSLISLAGAIVLLLGFLCIGDWKMRLLLWIAVVCGLLVLDLGQRRRVSNPLEAVRDIVANELKT